MSATMSQTASTAVGRTADAYQDRAQRTKAENERLAGLQGELADITVRMGDLRTRIERAVPEARAVVR